MSKGKVLVTVRNGINDIVQLCRIERKIRDGKEIVNSYTMRRWNYDSKTGLSTVETVPLEFHEMVEVVLALLEECGIQATEEIKQLQGAANDPD